MAIQKPKSDSSSVNRNQYVAMQDRFNTLQRQLYGTPRQGEVLNLTDALNNAKTDAQKRKIQAQFDTLKKEYDKLKTQIESIQQEEKAFKDIQNTEKVEKQRVSGQKQAQRNIDIYTGLLDTATRTGNAADIEKYTNLLKAANSSYIKSTTSQNPPPPPKGVAGQDPYVTDLTVTTDPRNGNIYLSDLKGEQAFIVVNPKTGKSIPDKDTKAGYFTSIDKARNALLAVTPSTEIAKLKSNLINSGYLKQSSVNDPVAYITALNDSIAKYSVDSVSIYQNNPKGSKLPKFNDYLVNNKVGGGGSKSTFYQVITTRADAKEKLNEYFTENLGFAPTPAQQDEYFNKLNLAENKSRQVNTTTSAGIVQTGSVFSDTDRILIAAQVAQKSLKGLDVNKIIGSKTGSQLALDIDSLLETAGDYAIPYTAAQALRDLSIGLGQENNVAKQKARLMQTAQIIHPTLKDHFAAGGNVRQVANTVASWKSQKLGVAVPDSTKDKDVMAAINNPGGMMSKPQFDMQMQGKEEWGLTEEARDIASDFVRTIGRSFGFIV
jgi:hypothetical protein